jgi:hypothetical protein
MIKIKNIIRYEQLSGKSFSDFDSNDENDVITLLYCIELPKEAFEVYKKTAKVAEKALFNEIKKINDEMILINQFSSVKLEESNTVTESDAKKHEMVSNIASTLVYGGLDAHYVMEEMEIADLPIFVKGLENKKKEELENCRLWTFFNILPHVGKGIKEPQDLIKFPWEKSEKEPENAEDGENIFKEFIHGNIN